MKDLSLYIHIPFCSSKCSYCDFLSFACKDEKIHSYIDALLIELELYKEKIMDYEIKTIFIGGGTPSSIDEIHITRILNYIMENYNVERLEEVSIESNPGSLSKEKVKAYKDSGVNRISMGLQSLNDNILKNIGRTHSSKDFYNSLEIIREVGIDNINADLMFGLPGQSLSDVLYSLDQVLKLEIEHISYYGLILEEGTDMYRRYEKGEIQLPSEDEEREMYHNIVRILKEHGYQHYEISNFSKPGYSCKHNLTYWDIKPYLGIGLNSHSNMEDKRFSNTINIEDYISKLKNRTLPVIEEVNIFTDTEIEEFCIFGLRKIRGIDKLDFKKRFNKNIEDIYGIEIEKHVKNGLIINTDTNIRFTSLGLDLSNQVEVDFLI